MHIKQYTWIDLVQQTILVELYICTFWDCGCLLQNAFEVMVIEFANRIGIISCHQNSQGRPPEIHIFMLTQNAVEEIEQVYPHF